MIEDQNSQFLNNRQKQTWDKDKRGKCNNNLLVLNYSGILKVDSVVKFKTNCLLGI